MEKTSFTDRFHFREAATIFCAATISAIVLIAAYGKMFHPVETLKGWDRSVAAFEVLFVLGLWKFRNLSSYWILSSLLFASFGGYAYFWYSLELPCSCMGEFLKIPSLTTLSIDASLCVTSLAIAFLLRASMQIFSLTTITLAPLGAMGFFLAQFIYDLWVKNA